jgi:hypothetical protein
MTNSRNNHNYQLKLSRISSSTNHTIVTNNTMSELVYHNGHYYRVNTRRSNRHDGRRHHRDRRESQVEGALRKTHNAWDQVLYGIGSAYYKLGGR